ncbi:hypothetical protein AVEN_53021-1 [Araneus ventricosus]|uniref:Uncharacterized protein n=1 Tax=Araneus ventricosus TaxID=182803 RepID=A0A4Y2GCF1_ARAVE|nr:hypothetical protein AVEN_53021-1 [Araneus ventricosus]
MTEGHCLRLSKMKADADKLLSFRNLFTAPSHCLCKISTFLNLDYYSYLQNEHMKNTRGKVINSGPEIKDKCSSVTRPGLRQFKLNLLEISHQKFSRATNTAFCWNVQYVFISSSELSEDQA